MVYVRKALYYHTYLGYKHWGTPAMWENTSPVNKFTKMYLSKPDVNIWDTGKGGTIYHAKNVPRYEKRIGPADAPAV